MFKLVWPWAPWARLVWYLLFVVWCVVMLPCVCCLLILSQTSLKVVVCLCMFSLLHMCVSPMCSLLVDFYQCIWFEFLMRWLFVIRFRQRLFVVRSMRFGDLCVQCVFIVCSHDLVQFSVLCWFLFLVSFLEHGLFKSIVCCNVCMMLFWKCVFCPQSIKVPVGYYYYYY